MAPRPEHPEAAPTPVRTPVERDCVTKQTEGTEEISSPNLDITENDIGRGEELPLRPSSDAKLARSVSNRTARPQRFFRAPPPDGGWGWMVLLGVVIGNILIIGHAKTFGVYITTLIERFDEKPSTVAWIQSIQFSFFLGFAPIASMLAERFSPRTVTLVGAVIACSGMALSSRAKSIVHLYFSYGVMMGLAAVFTFTPGVIMIAKYFDRRRGLANGLGMAGNSLGGIFMPILADFLISEYSLHGGFLIMGGILLNAAVGAMLWRPVETVNNVRGRTSSATAKTVPIPTLSAQASTANEKVSAPLIQDNVTATDDKLEAVAILPDEVPSEVFQPPKDLIILDNADNSLSSGANAVSNISCPLPLPSLCSTSVPDISAPTAASAVRDVPANFEVQSQPSASPPPLQVNGGSQRKNRDKVDRSLETQQSLDHQSIFSQSTASLSSFVFLSTFHLGPSFGTVEDITNLRYDDDEEGAIEDEGDDQEDELNNLDDDSEDEDDDYDVYETVRARSDLKVDIAGLLAAGSSANETTSAPNPALREFGVVLHPKKAITPDPSTDISALKDTTPQAVDVPRSRASGRQRKSVAEKPTKPQVASARRRTVPAKPLKPTPRQRNKYFDFSFFRLHVFYVMMVPLFLHSIGYTTIQMYTPMYARSLGFSTSDSARCLSFLAFADVLGRIGCAWLSDLQLCKRKYFYMTGMLLSGMVAYCMPFAKTYLQLLICTSGFGLASGAYIGLTVALFADAFGNDKVAKAHSMATMCTGIAGLSGGPFIGYVLEKTRSFVICYSILGSCQILGGLVYFLEPWAAQTDTKKIRAQQWV
ncbi:uncharacterized protein LOC100903228 [Galendromus occidentalis]|uniref:Uncharacterized protein LOC100903228 n=1 Tax=Galendromus occidentalis TaxID=34638 RepID=A0AAJ7SH10_9ACAR|nr:uncharacterized protein LOC100903228 [Galendromus occidentalis]